MTFSRLPIEQTGCLTCSYYGEEWDGDFGEIFCGSTCSMFAHFANLKTFPFKKMLPCHILDFWHSEFVDLIDGTKEADDKAFALWREKYLPNQTSQCQKADNTKGG